MGLFNAGYGFNTGLLNQGVPAPGFAFPLGNTGLYNSGDSDSGGFNTGFFESGFFGPQQG